MGLHPASIEQGLQPAGLAACKACSLQGARSSRRGCTLQEQAARLLLAVYDFVGMFRYV
jgi:hypothetical protein